MQARMLIQAGVLLLTAGMIAVVAGVIATGVFLPGTWLIRIAFLCLAAGGVADVVRLATAGAPDSADGSPG